MQEKAHECAPLPLCMVTLEIEAQVPGGASEQVVRTVTESGRTSKFVSQGFEPE